MVELQKGFETRIQLYLSTCQGSAESGRLRQCRRGHNIDWGEESAGLEGGAVEKVREVCSGANVLQGVPIGLPEVQVDLRKELGSKEGMSGSGGALGLKLCCEI